METYINKCVHCKNDIPVGDTYVSITKNVEQVDVNAAIDEPNIDIIESEQLLAFCASCGNNIDSAMIVNLIGLLQARISTTK